MRNIFTLKSRLIYKILKYFIKILHIPIMCVHICNVYIFTYISYILINIDTYHLLNTFNLFKKQGIKPEVINVALPLISRVKL